MLPEKVARKFKWVKIGADGVPEFYCDNSMLSALRQCESFFDLTYLQHIRHTTRNWNFDFGSWLHSCLELFYLHEFRKGQKLFSTDLVIPAGKEEDYDYCPKGKFIAHGLMLWDKMNMDYFKDKHKSYKALDGALGAVALLSDYWEVYGGGKERFRVIGIELPFGLGKEVPIADKNFYYPLSIQLLNTNEYGFTPATPLNSELHEKFRAYLTGRLDLLIADNFNDVSVMDHKTTAFFDGSEGTRYNPNDGILGYVFTGDNLIKRINPSKSCRKAWVNFLCLSQKDRNDKANNKVILRPELRFTRAPMTFSPEQLNEYRLRQISTFNALYELVILERPFQWNTLACDDMFHKECPFRDVHSITPSQRDAVIKSQYKIVEEWNPFRDESK